MSSKPAPNGDRSAAGDASGLDHEPREGLHRRHGHAEGAGSQQEDKAATPFDVEAAAAETGPASKDVDAFVAGGTAGAGGEGGAAVGIVDRVTYLDIAKQFSLLGWTAFGGPAAHIGIMQRVREPACPAGPTPSCTRRVRCAAQAGRRCHSPPITLPCPSAAPGGPPALVQQRGVRRGVCARAVHAGAVVDPGVVRGRHPQKGARVPRARGSGVVRAQAALQGARAYEVNTHQLHGAAPTIRHTDALGHLHVQTPPGRHRRPAVGRAVPVPWCHNHGGAGGVRGPVPGQPPGVAQRPHWRCASGGATKTICAVPPTTGWCLPPPSAPIATSAPPTPPHPASRRLSV